LIFLRLLIQDENLDCVFLPRLIFGSFVLLWLFVDTFFCLVLGFGFRLLDGFLGVVLDRIVVNLAQFKVQLLFLAFVTKFTRRFFYPLFLFILQFFPLFLFRLAQLLLFFTHFIVLSILKFLLSRFLVLILLFLLLLPLLLVDFAEVDERDGL